MPESLPDLDEECFFIAPIGAEDSPERDRSDGVLEFIVGRAAEELGLQAVRADRISEPGQITLQVIDHILGAKAAVADVTDLNANVFYELAVRHTARMPVAIIAEKGCKLPFDIGQMRTIFFDHTDLRSADHCRREIVGQLQEALERDLVDSPISTTLDLRAMSGGDALERSIADIRTGIEDVARTQREMGAYVERLADATRRRSIHIHPEAVRDALEKFDLLEELAVEREDLELREYLDNLERPLRYIARRVHTNRPENRFHVRERRGQDDLEEASPTPDEDES